MLKFSVSFSDEARYWFKIANSPLPINFNLHGHQNPIEFLSRVLIQTVTLKQQHAPVKFSTS